MLNYFYKNENSLISSIPQTGTAVAIRKLFPLTEKVKNRELIDKLESVIDSLEKNWVKFTSVLNFYQPLWK